MKRLDLKLSDFETIEGYRLYCDTDIELYKKDDHLEIWSNKDYHFHGCIDKVSDFEKRLFDLLHMRYKYVLSLPYENLVEKIKKFCEHYDNKEM